MLDMDIHTFLDLNIEMLCLLNLNNLLRIIMPNMIVIGQVKNICKNVNKKRHI